MQKQHVCLPITFSASGIPTFVRDVDTVDSGLMNADSYIAANLRAPYVSNFVALNMIKFLRTQREDGP
jgi:hypothetical protein